METRELAGMSFACLEGCGFCCTFQPEVSQRELALLRARFRPRPVNVTIGEDRTYLQLQSGCGACTLLSRKACTAYDLRPAHCRYFPFHVHFGERPEAYVNYTCRGVARVPDGTLAEAFAGSVLGVAREDELAEHAELARDTYAQFQRKARRAGAWGDARAAAADALTAGAAMFSRAWVERACADAGEPASAEEALEDALAHFGAAEVTKRPFYLAPDLRWLTFEREGDALRVLEMDERGELLPQHVKVVVSGWADASPELAGALHAYAARLVGRDVFLGGAYALVDDRDYALTVENAARLRLAEIVVDLTLRARILEALGTPRAQLADEVARFYDATFLDSPTIGGWL